MPVAVTPEEAPAPQMSNRTQVKRKATDQPDQADQPEIYFKAFRPGEFRQLSNLFGPVEWKYQQAKFKEGSEVYNFLEKGYQKTLANKFTLSEFEATLKAMGHGGEVKSYVDSDNKLATGLIAQMTSVIAKNPESELARKRLKYIIGLEKTSDEKILAKDWHKKNVNKVLTDEEANELMLTLLREKYENEEYKNLLLKSGKRILHEGKGRGAPNKWEWQAKPLSSENVAKGFTRGGDELGKLLTQVRTEIQEPSPPSAKRNALQPSS